ncbi:hypothetical protein PHMEG_00017330 [Phytophthora megakarya]|uniref:RxLR effector protein n=1 Tax=Phytophthora megakarya TaxID=4795 RepID=A0A225VWV0_9STRA|nr:hypothetical protein PHMEG_00017330 [Phytophthora megakarya]
MFPSENIIPTNRFLRSDKNADTEKYKGNEERATESGTIEAIAFYIQQGIKTWARFLRSDKNADTEKYKDDEERATESGTIKAIAFHIQQSIKTWAKNTKNWMLVNQGASFDELYQKGVQPSQYFEALGLKKLFDTKAAAHAARYGDEKILSITDPKYLKFWKYKMHWNGKLMEKNRVVENLV